MFRLKFMTNAVILILTLLISRFWMATFLVSLLMVFTFLNLFGFASGKGCGLWWSRISLTLCCFVVHSKRRFVLNIALCYFVLVFFSSFSITITSLGEERANLSVFCTFVRFALFWLCLFPLPLGVWEGLRLVIAALPGLFSYIFIRPFEKRDVLCYG